jgi:acetolactate synthase-1/2/3 large subunit
MRSNPLHRMSPDLPAEVEERVLIHFNVPVSQT